MMIKPAGEFIAEAKAQCSCLDVEKAKSFHEENNNCVILDVREPHEANESNLQGSINIPRGVLEMKVANTISDPNTPILVHCMGAGRASLATLRLQEMGYTNAHVIDAGYADIKASFD